MRSPEKTILQHWDITAAQLTQVIDANPSLRGIMLGYLAELKLQHMWFDRPEIEKCFKYDDHDRARKGDLLVVYKGKDFVVEVKSLQTNTVRREGNLWLGKVQCDASDRRSVKLPNGKILETTCLLAAEFDLLAVNLFAFENKWRFAFAKNSDLPKSSYRKYAEEDRQYLLATLMNVSWPPKPPFRKEPFSIFDQML